MLLGAAITWWYGPGWAGQARQAGKLLDRAMNEFSMSELLKTFFAPFRQISAGKVGGNISIQFRAFLDRLFSRLIGAVVRSLLLLIGGLWVSLIAVFSLIKIIIWPLVPLMPIFGIVLFIVGARL